MLPSLQNANRSETTASLMASAEFLSGILREITQPFAVVDRRGRFVLWNRAFEKLSAYSPVEFLEIHASDLSASQDSETDHSVAEQVLQTGQTPTLPTQ